MNRTSTQDWILWRALRIAIVCTIVQWFVKNTHPILGHWILITLVIIANIDVGSSLWKMFDRAIGVTAGCSLGFILGATIIQFHYNFVYLAVLWVFLAWYALGFRYQIAFFFMMLMLTSLFYILSPVGESAREILTYRVVNIYIGLLIGFVVELAFPINRSSTKLHASLQQHWGGLCHVIKQLTQPDFDQQLQKITTDNSRYIENVSLSNFEKVLFHNEAPRLKKLAQITFQFSMQLSNLHHLLTSEALTLEEKKQIQLLLTTLTEEMQTPSQQPIDFSKIHLKSTVDILKNLSELVQTWWETKGPNLAVISHSTPSALDNASRPYKKK